VATLISEEESLSVKLILFHNPKVVLDAVGKKLCWGFCSLVIQPSVKSLHSQLWYWCPLQDKTNIYIKFLEHSVVCLDHLISDQSTQHFHKQYICVFCIDLRVSCKVGTGFLLLCIDKMKASYD